MTPYATKTRLRRLAEVRRGEIWKYGDDQSYDHYQYRVTAAMEELRRAGWVELGEAGAVKTPWRLTEAGAAVLERAREKAK